MKQLEFFCDNGYVLDECRIVGTPRRFIGLPRGGTPAYDDWIKLRNRMEEVLLEIQLIVIGLSETESESLDETT